MAVCGGDSALTLRGEHEIIEGTTEYKRPATDRHNDPLRV